MKKMISRIICFFLLASFSYVISAKLVENRDYILLAESADNIVANKGKIDVVVFFSAGCPYCYMLEPEIEAWLAQKPINTTFTRVAIPRNGRWVEYARLFYALGMISSEQQERLTRLLYPAIHEQKLNFDHVDNLIDWAVAQGVSRNELSHYYFSQDVTDKLSQALELAQLYDLKYVPSIYLNNKYQLVLDGSNHYQGTKDKINQMITLLEK